MEIESTADPLEALRHIGAYLLYQQKWDIDIGESGLDYERDVDVYRDQLTAS